MISAAYLVLTICHGICQPNFDLRQSINTQTIPLPSMDQCVRQANAFNTKRRDMSALCVKGSDK